MNALTIYLLISLVFVVIAMIEFAVVLLVHRLQEHDKDGSLTKAKNNATAGWPLTNENGVPNLLRKHDAEQSTPGTNILKKRQTAVNLSTNKIDVAALTISINLYLLFNCAYWLHYLLL